MQILFRKSMADKSEFEACKSVFKDSVIENRSDIKAGHTIIPRYSALPYYKELEYDVKNQGSILINPYSGHRWIADFEWYSVPELAANTFKTFNQDEFVYAPEGQYVVKGATNSKKWAWNRSMFGPTKIDAIKIGCNLREDSLIGSQDIIFREYIPLMPLGRGINGLPFVHEWRFFFFKEELIDYGFYWSVAENTKNKDDCPGSVYRLAHKLSKICSRYVNFFVLDVALKKDGNPILVEINDGSMSGLSCIDELDFYAKLQKTTHYNLWGYVSAQ